MQLSMLSLTRWGGRGSQALAGHLNFNGWYFVLKFFTPGHLRVANWVTKFQKTFLVRQNGQIPHNGQKIAGNPPLLASPRSQPRFVCHLPTPPPYRYDFDSTSLESRRRENVLIVQGVHVLRLPVGTFTWKSQFRSALLRLMYSFRGK